MARRRRKRSWPVLAGGAFVALAALGAIVAAVLVYGARNDLVVNAPSCGTGPTTDGIDVSYYQETIDWHRVYRAGIRFAFIRMSDGTGVIDSMFKRNWSEAKVGRLARGAYQFFRPEQSAIAQADLLIAAIARDPGELAPVIDVEVTGGRSPEQLGKAVHAWVDRVRERLHVEPIVYASPDFWRDQVGGADLSAQPLWVAHYTKDCPRVPAPWRAWTFWQHSKSGQVPGIEGPVDLDVFAGSLETLRAR